MDKRIGDIRHRVESAISHQGRIWLTLVHNLKELADERTMAATGVAGESVPLWHEADAAARDPTPPPVVSTPVPRSAPPPAASTSKAPVRRPLRRPSDASQ